MRSVPHRISCATPPMRMTHVLLQDQLCDTASAHDACSLAESEYFREYRASRLRESWAGCLEREEKKHNTEG